MEPKIENTNQPEKKSKNWMLYAAGVLFIILGIVITVAVLKHNSAKNEQAKITTEKTLQKELAKAKDEAKKLKIDLAKATAALAVKPNDSIAKMKIDSLANALVVVQDSLDAKNNALATAQAALAAQATSSKTPIASTTTPVVNKYPDRPAKGKLNVNDAKKIVYVRKSDRQNAELMATAPDGYTVIELPR